LAPAATFPVNRVDPHTDHVRTVESRYSKTLVIVGGQTARRVDHPRPGRRLKPLEHHPETTEEWFDALLVLCGLDAAQFVGRIGRYHLDYPTTHLSTGTPTVTRGITL
jgi:ferric-dicitrate binding protein FerR (iron transport regulator)